MAAASRAPPTALGRPTPALPSTPRAATRLRHPAPSITSPSPRRPRAFSATATARSRVIPTRSRPSGRITRAQALGRPPAPALATRWTTGSPWHAEAPTHPATCSGCRGRRTAPRAPTSAGGSGYSRGGHKFSTSRMAAASGTARTLARARSESLVSTVSGWPSGGTRQRAVHLQRVWRAWQRLGIEVQLVNSVGPSHLGAGNRTWMVG
jgi:hypothetical protein